MIYDASAGQLVRARRGAHPDGFTYRDNAKNRQ